jgi:hypothetical protein
LLMHCTDSALILALLKAGRSMAAKMAIMAITTSNSINVKALVKLFLPSDRVEEFDLIQVSMD